MASDTFSDIIGVLLMGTGNDNNAWGTNCNNSVFKVFEKAIAGVASHTVTGGTLNLSGSAPPAGPTQVIEAIQAFSGTLASDQTVVVPNLSKLWLVNNATTGAFDLAFKTPDGTISAPIPQGGWGFVYCDGADNIEIGLSTTLRDVQWLGADGTLAAPGLSFAAEPTIGFRRVSDGVIALTIDGTDILTISAASITVNGGTTFSIVPPGTESDYAGIFEPSGWYFEYGQTKSRTTDAALFNAICPAFTADTNGTVTLQNVSQNFVGLGIEGAIIEGIGIPSNTTIASVTSTTITLSNAATTTSTGVAMRAFIYGNGDATTTFNLPDRRGRVVAGRDNMGGTAANRLTSAGSGIAGTTLKASGGAESVTLVTANLPPYTPAGTISITDPGHFHKLFSSGAASAAPPPLGDFPISYNNGSNGFYFSYTMAATSAPAPLYGNSSTATTGITAAFAGSGQGGTSTPFSNAQPTGVSNKIIKR